jgi:hypothetical protein
MAPKITSSSNRNKRSTKKPVTGAKPSNRANRQSTSTARVTQSGGGRGGGARVTNASQRTSGSARVTGSVRPALPPGRQGGAMVRQETKPENPRRTSARSRQATASRGTTGPNRVGQPAGSSNRMYGANRVNQAVGRAVASTRLGGVAKAAGRLALPVAIGAQIADVKGGFDKLAKHPFIQKMNKGGKAPSAGRRTNPKAAKPASAKPNMDRPGLRYEKMTDTRAPRSAYGLKDKPEPPTTPARSTAPSRSSAPARSTAPASRPAASRPSTPKSPSTSSAPKVAGTSGIGPVKSGAEYARAKGSISETTRQLREMRKRSEERQKKK